MIARNIRKRMWPIRSQLIVSFLKFGGLSGLAWLFDITIFVCLVQFTDALPFVANFASSVASGLGVFLLSRQMIFMKAAGSLLMRISIYVVYVVIVIVVASAAIQFVAGQIGRLAALHAMPLSVTLAALAAKIVVTPPQLLLNFFVARFLSERGMVKAGLTDA